MLIFYFNVLYAVKLRVFNDILRYYVVLSRINLYTASGNVQVFVLVKLRNFNLFVTQIQIGYCH